MLLDEVILRPRDRSKILRVLEQGENGSLLYTCRPTTEGNTEVRLFEPGKDVNKLLYVHQGSSEIVNGSLNPDHNILAFTVRDTRSGSTSSRTSLSSVVATDLKDNQKSAATSDISEKIGPDWIYLAGSRTPQESDLDAELESRPQKRGNSSSLSSKAAEPEKGVYTSYLVDIFPTTFVRKFDVARRYYQRVVFTSCNVERNMNGTVVRENRLLLLMDKKSIGVYTIALMPSSGPGKDGDIGDAKTEKCRSAKALQSVMIVSKALWSQWDPRLQQLYYLVVSRKKHTERSSGNIYFTYTTSLCCEQLSDQQMHQQMFVCPIDLGLSTQLLTDKGSAHLLSDMENTISPVHLNMKVLPLENCVVCLCWQVLSPVKNDNVLYNIAVLHNDVVLQCTPKVASSGQTSWTNLVSFTSFGRNILVHSSNFLTHLLAVDMVSNDFGVFPYHCHFIRCMENLNKYNFVQMPHEFPSTSGTQCHVFDQDTKSVVRLSLNRSNILELFFDEKLSLENKIALSRYASLLMRNQATSFPYLPVVLRNFLEKDMILKGDKILATFLIQMALNDVCTHFPLSNLHHLLPSSIPMKFPCSEDFTFEVRECDVRTTLLRQLESIEKEGSSRFNGIWEEVCFTFRSGMFEHYPLRGIDEEVHLVKRNNHNPTMQDQKCAELKRLDEIFEHEILPLKQEGNFEREEESILECFSSDEMDCNCENLMALHYEKLSDHLKCYLPAGSHIKAYARSYVIAQLRVVNHLIALFLLVTRIDDHDQPLFHPVQTEERNLLRLLNQLHSACLLINFPLPRGFQTFLTCLTFRCCLTTHLPTSNEEFNNFEFSDTSSSRSNSFNGIYPSTPSKEDMADFSFQFFQLVDTSCIHLTGEFVARLLEETPDHESYGSFMHQVLSRAKFESPLGNPREGLLQLWKNPHSNSTLAKIQLKKLEEIRKTGKWSKYKGGLTRKTSTSFLPLDVFLLDVHERASKFDADVSYVEAATMQHTVRKYGKENLKHISF